MAAAEPTLAAYRNPLARYAAATRPAFLSVTLVGCLLGLASAQAGGAVLRPLEAFLTLAFALVAHAGIDVLNDYHDALNGSDAANTERRFPYTGGSRFIQNAVLSLRATDAARPRKGESLTDVIGPAHAGTPDPRPRQLRDAQQSCRYPTREYQLDRPSLKMAPPRSLSRNRDLQITHRKSWAGRTRLR